MKKSEKIINYLIENGCKEVKTTSSKYRKFSLPKFPDIFYFVGKNGALRKGKNISESFSLTYNLKK